MILTLKRKYFKEEYTIGDLYLNGKWFCNTIEDKDRGLNDAMELKTIQREKIYGVTAIPTGRYKVSITYSSKYKKKMPLLENVKGFYGIRIHSGNTAKDSLGCIIVGENKKKGMVINSRVTYNKLMDILKDEKEIFIIIES